ncbi:MAG: T9SS type A sorting domain-containing protein [PVC group bacterium]|nr:T9SS type A sorting domain-containing protein [PVC group bacterium]
MRKLILLFTLIAFACTPLVAMSATNAYGGFVMLQSRTVEGGETFTVEVTLSGSDANLTSMVVPIIIGSQYVSCTGVSFIGGLNAGTIDRTYSISADEVIIRYLASPDGATSTITETSGLIATLTLKVDNDAPDHIATLDAIALDLSFEANGQSFSRWNRLEFADESGTGAILPSFAPSVLNIKKSSTGIDDEIRGNLPKSFELSQNYPNPFNPSTNIAFALPTKSNVKLEIFNLLGQKVADLAQGQMEAGYHEVTWNANNTPSGVYFYRIITDEQSLTRKMMLLK